MQIVLRHSYLFLIGLLFSLFLNAQEHYFVRHPAFYRLPTYECYNINCDKQGYIWLGTFAGLYKYNGDTISVATDKNDPEQQSIYGVSETSADALLVLTKNNFLFEYAKDKKLIKKIKKFDRLYSKLNDEKVTTYLTYKDSEELYGVNQVSTYKINCNNGYYEFLKPFDSSATYNYLETSEGIIPVKKIISEKELSKIYSTETITVALKRNRSVEKYSIKLNNHHLPSWRSYTQVNKEGEIYISIDNILIRLNKGGKMEVTYLPHEIISLYVDNDSDLWVGTLKAGLHYYSKGDITKKAVVSLPECAVTGVCMDKLGGVWCSTYEKGVFYCRNKYLINYSNHKSLSSLQLMLKSDNGKVFCSSGRGQLSIIDNNIVEHIIVPNIKSFIKDVVSYRNSYYISADGAHKADVNFKQTYYIKHSSVPVFTAPLGIFERDHKLFCMSTNGLLEIKGQEAFFADSIGSLTSRLLVKNGRIFILNEAGIFELKDKLVKISDTKNYNIKRFDVDKENNFWILTDDDKIIKIEKGKEIDSTKYFNIEHKKVLDFKFDKLNQLWLCGNGFLQKMRVEKGKFIKTKTIGLRDGLPSDKIRGVLPQDDVIYLNTDEGLFSLPLTYGSDVVVPEIYLTDIETDYGKSTSQTLSLPYNYQKCAIHFEALTYKSIDFKPSVFYLIEGKYHDWKKTNSSFIDLAGLREGKYTVRIKTSYGIGGYQKNEIVVEINVSPPIWRTLWFYICVAILLAIFIYLLVNKIVNRIKAREAEKTNLNNLVSKYQMNALQAQMNPHFLFNAINGIQMYILKKNNQDAYDYLAKFSKLIRLVLDSTHQTENYLWQEIEIIQLYVELEQMRFENVFEFELVIKDDVDVFQISVPAMLIQPHVENAIWHGIMKLESNRKGKLLVEIRNNEEGIQIIIEDNGVGRMKSREINSDKQHTSKGMLFIDERIKVLNRIDTHRKIQLNIIDLVDDSNVPTGTRVEILIVANEH